MSMSLTQLVRTLKLKTFDTRREGVLISVETIYYIILKTISFKKTSFPYGTLNRGGNLCWVSCLNCVNIQVFHCIS